MRTRNLMQLKSFVKDRAVELGVAQRDLLHNYYMECFVDRLAHSKYADSFVLKGGFLIASMMGLNRRTTMDLDTTVKNMPLNEKNMAPVLREICSVEVDDDFTFSLDHLELIREEAEYQGQRAYFFVDYERMRGSLTMDITTGDSIYPAVAEAFFKKHFETGFIKTLAYPIENILAEKMEAIITRKDANTRPRDYYDVHVLTNTVKFEKVDFMQALLRTAEHRGTRSIIENESVERLAVIKNSDDVKRQWSRYQARFPYAKEIAFEEVMTSVRKLMEKDPL